jgi:hypothetical protein
VTAHLDRWVELSYKNLDPDTPPVVENDGGTVTYDEYDPTDGTGDYEINYEHGLIRALSSGTITEGQTLEVGSTWLAITDGWKVSGGSLQKLEGRIRMLGVDQDNDRRVEVDVYKVNLTPSGDINLISEEFAQIEFTGDIQYDATEAGTYAITYLAGV